MLHPTPGGYAGVIGAGGDLRGGMRKLVTLCARGRGELGREQLFCNPSLDSLSRSLPVNWWQIAS